LCAQAESQIVVFGGHSYAGNVRPTQHAVSRSLVFIGAPTSWQCHSRALRRASPTDRPTPRRRPQGKFCYFNDTHVLDTETFTWHLVQCSGSVPPPRFGHSVELVGSAGRCDGYFRVLQSPTPYATHHL